MFRLLAPTATTVTLGGDHPIGANVAMAKGVWSATVGPLEADFYSYFFTVDGVRTLDWRNALVMRDGARYASWLRVPGPEAADYQANDVPHGTVSQVWCPSPSLGARRRMYVYTPPGYETGSDRYPVLYLLHGEGGDPASRPTFRHRRTPRRSGVRTSAARSTRRSTSLSTPRSTPA